MDETAEGLVASLVHGVERLNALVTDLIDLGRAGGADYPVKLEEIDVGHVLHSAEAMLRPAFMLREQSVSVEVPERGPYAITDRRLLDQVVLNLLSNANRHSPPRGDVTLAARREQGLVRVEVRDSGPGIPPEDRRRIFEPYYRVRHNDVQVPGSGLGLAVARRMVDALDGRLWVEGADGGGAIFVVELRASSER
jgi:signal transduction histidine kinase